MKHIVGFSGGIDSQAVYRWLRNRYKPADVIAINSQAGRWEHPLTATFISEFVVLVAPVIEVVPLVKDIWITDEWAEKERGMDGDVELTMELLVSIKNRPPSRKAKFCTEILKLRPQKRWISEHFGPAGEYAGESYTRYAGVRRDESMGRSNSPIEQWDSFFDCELIYPLADWTKKMCFDYVLAHGEPVNPLYALGCDRVGCMPCIEAGKNELANMAERFPEMIQRVADLERRTGKTFLTSKVPGMASADIHETLRWAKTARGGRQDQFPIMHEREACESKYGLCE